MDTGPHYACSALKVINFAGIASERMAVTHHSLSQVYHLSYTCKPGSQMGAVLLQIYELNQSWQLGGKQQ